MKSERPAVVLSDIGPAQVRYLRPDRAIWVWLIVLLPSRGFRATRTLWVAVFRRRFLTIVLPLHRLGELLHYTP